MCSADNGARRRWMGLLAKARPDEVRDVWTTVERPAGYDLLRRPEAGLVMVRGRIGGDGAPFNFGEMTVTRCSVRLTDGTVGHAWIAGRDTAHAENAALLDALLQSAPDASAVWVRIHRLESLQAARHDDSARKAASTRVDFFTLVRGED